MATIRDVAKAAGVSIATVSRVLNRPDAVSGETRDRVEATIARLNFRPDATARRLSSGRAFAIGIILPFLTRPSYVERLRGVEATLSHSPYDLVVTNVETATKRDSYFQSLARERRWDGTLVMSLPPTDAEVERFQSAGAAVVLLDTTHPRLPSVDVDDVAGGWMAADYLLRRGHRRLAFLGDLEHELHFSASQERLRGFAACLRESGVALAEADCFWVTHSRREARGVVAHILARPPQDRPTALFAAADTTALGVLDGLRQHGLAAPDDLAVLGFDDLEVADLYNLSTIRQPLFESGVRGVESLLALLDGQPPDSVLLPLTLVPRATA